MINNKQQTAVEWLFSQNYFIQVIFGTENIILKNIIDQAKAMEKEQIIDAHNQGIWPTPKAFDDGEQYYNETYGGGEQ